MMGKKMLSIENLPNGKFGLNVYTDDGIIKHIFDTMDEVKKYLDKAMSPKYREYDHDIY